MTVSKHFLCSFFSYNPLPDVSDHSGYYHFVHNSCKKYRSRCWESCFQFLQPRYAPSLPGPPFHSILVVILTEVVYNIVHSLWCVPSIRIFFALLCTRFPFLSSCSNTLLFVYVWPRIFLVVICRATFQTLPIFGLKHPLLSRSQLLKGLQERHSRGKVWF